MMCITRIADETGAVMTSAGQNSPSATDGVAAPSHQALLDEITGSNAWLSLVWEAAPDAMAFSDPDGIVLLVNAAYCTLYGYHRDEIVGHSFAIIFPPQHRDSAIQQYHQLFAAADPIPMYETWIQRED